MLTRSLSLKSYSRHWRKHQFRGHPNLKLTHHHICPVPVPVTIGGGHGLAGCRFQASQGIREVQHAAAEQVFEARPKRCAVVLEGNKGKAVSLSVSKPGSFVCTLARCRLVRVAGTTWEPMCCLFVSTESCDEIAFVLG